MGASAGCDCSSWKHAQRILPRRTRRHAKRLRENTDWLAIHAVSHYRHVCACVQKSDLQLEDSSVQRMLRADTRHHQQKTQEIQGKSAFAPLRDLRGERWFVSRLSTN